MHRHPQPAMLCGACCPLPAVHQDVLRREAVAHVEANVAGATALRSGDEWRRWLTTYVKLLAAEEDTVSVACWDACIFFWSGLHVKCMVEYVHAILLKAGEQQECASRTISPAAHVLCVYIQVPPHPAPNADELMPQLHASLHSCCLPASCCFLCSTLPPLCLLFPVQARLREVMEELLGPMQWTPATHPSSPGELPPNFYAPAAVTMAAAAAAAVRAASSWWNPHAIPGLVSTDKRRFLRAVVLPELVRTRTPSNQKLAEAFLHQLKDAEAFVKQHEAQAQAGGAGGGVQAGGPGELGEARGQMGLGLGQAGMVLG